MNELDPPTDTDTLVVAAPPAPPALPAAGQDASGTDLIDAEAAVDLPTSFGVFKPVGHVMVGVPTQVQADSLTTVLHDAGWAGPAVQQFSPRESAAELRTMVDKASTLAGFGYEITLLRRYLELTELGFRWLLVKVTDTAHAEAAAAVARGCGATLAVHYRRLTVEELIN